MFLLDTCVIGDFIRGEQGTVDKIRSLSPSILYVSVITHMEIFYGLNKNPEKSKKIKPMIDLFLNSVSILDWTIEESIIAADCRNFLGQLGTPIGPYDLLIAAHAIRRNLILVTANDSEFKRVKNIHIENWRIKN